MDSVRTDEATAATTLMSDGNATVTAIRPQRRTIRSSDSFERLTVTLLVEGARAGEQEAWNALVERFSGTVWAMARGHRLNQADASDVFQTTWMLLLEHLDRVEQPERVGAWLATTARRECLRVIRMSGRQVPKGDDFDSMPSPKGHKTPHDDLISEERSRIINQLVEQLPARLQILLRLLTADSPLSYKDISESLGMPIGSIGPTRARALEQLKRVAESSGIDLSDVFYD